MLTNNALVIGDVLLDMTMEVTQNESQTVHLSYGFHTLNVHRVTVLQPTLLATTRLPEPVHLVQEVYITMRCCEQSTPVNPNYFQ